MTNLIKGLVDRNDRDRIASVILLLSQEFCKSRNANHRKGGLIGLAAVCISLPSKYNMTLQQIQQQQQQHSNSYSRHKNESILSNGLELYLHILVPPVLERFYDPESRVVYYACESMYNITKLARSSVLVYFNQIFDGLCTLFAHVDVEVKNGEFSLILVQLHVITIY